METKNFIDALRSRGGRDGILTLPEVFTYVEKLKIQPRFGEFGDNAPGSDFIFVAADKVKFFLYRCRR